MCFILLKLRFYILYFLFILLQKFLFLYPFFSTPFLFIRSRFFSFPPFLPPQSHLPLVFRFSLYCRHAFQFLFPAFIWRLSPLLPLLNYISFFLTPYSDSFDSSSQHSCCLIFLSHLSLFVNLITPYTSTFIFLLILYWLSHKSEQAYLAGHW